MSFESDVEASWQGGREATSVRAAPGKRSEVCHQADDGLGGGEESLRTQPILEDILFTIMVQNDERGLLRVA